MSSGPSIPKLPRCPQRDSNPCCHLERTAWGVPPPLLAGICPAQTLKDRSQYCSVVPGFFRPGMVQMWCSALSRRHVRGTPFSITVLSCGEMPTNSPSGNNAAGEKPLCRGRTCRPTATRGVGACQSSLLHDRRVSARTGCRSPYSEHQRGHHGSLGHLNAYARPAGTELARLSSWPGVG